MALSLAKAQQKIQTKIFDAIGSNATLENVSSSSLDDDGYGDVTYAYSDAVTATLVPFNSVETESFQPFGDLQAGELDMIIPHGTVLNHLTKITYKSKVYRVKEIETYPYQNGSLAYAVRLAKIL